MRHLDLRKVTHKWRVEDRGKRLKKSRTVSVAVRKEESGGGGGGGEFLANVVENDEDEREQER